jgi:hypothetical protein
MRYQEMHIVSGILFCLTVSGLLSECSLPGISPSRQPRLDEAIRRELIAMRDADQQARLAMLQSSGSLTMTNVRELDRRHIARMKEIIGKHGWPGRSLVGEDGAGAAWLLVQHSREDPQFMRQCLSLMEQAVPRGDASPKHLAYLVDNMRVSEGRPQGYGTQFMKTRDGRLVPYPI